MPIGNAFSGAGVFKPQDLAILHEVLQMIAHDEDTEVDRESRAAALVRLYQSGVRTRDALCEAMGYYELQSKSVPQAPESSSLWRQQRY